MAKPEPAEHDSVGASNDGFRELPTVTADSAKLTQVLPDRIGRYHIKRIIASGGMGTVYEATQDNPRRVVAVKVMKQGIASKSALRRFEYEGQILGRLRHPGIAQIYEAGVHSFDQSRGRKPADTSDDPSRERERAGDQYRDSHGAVIDAVPYFAMEYIPNAKTITNYAEEKKLGTRQRMELFAKVCDAIHHGHQKGIIHRDLKPSNILVTSDPTAPPLTKGGTGGVVKVIDFGVARSTDSDMAVTTLQTDVGQLIGTLQYMSPEQCEGDPHDIDTRSDVYALGVVFYQLLCGRLPYDVTRMAMHQATRAIREQTPTKLSTLDKTFRGDVETIALKALEKERERRYQSAADFGHDIQRYLTGEAILARRASIVYQLRLFARRNKAVFASLAAVFVVLLSGIIVSTLLYLRAEANLSRALVAEKQSAADAETARHVSEFLVDLFNVSDPSESKGNTVTAREILDQGAEKVAGELKDQPLVQATLMETMGRVYASLGLYDDARRLAKNALEVRSSRLGTEHADVAVSLNRLGMIERLKGNYPEAEVLLRRSLDLRRRLFGDEHPDVAETLSNLGAVLSDQGDFEEAEKLHRQAVELRRKLDAGGDATDLATSLSALGLLLWKTGRYGEAEPLLSEAVVIRREALGTGHAETLIAMNNLALVLMDRKELAEAEKLFSEVVATGREVLKEGHPDLATWLNNLATVRQNRGDYVGAEPLFREALEMFRTRLGDEHPNTIQSLNNLGLVLFLQSDYEGAEPLFRTALAGVHKLLGAEHPHNATILRNLGRVLGARKDHAAATVCFRDSLNLLRKSFPEDHTFVVDGLRLLCDALLGEGVAMTDEVVLRQCMELRRKSDPVSSWKRALTDSLFGAWLTTQGSYAEAEPLLVEGFQAVLSSGEPTTAQKVDAAAHIVRLYESWEAAEPGKGYAEKAAEWRDKLDELKAETKKRENVETSK